MTFIIALALMPASDLARLAALARGGDVAARNEIVEAHFPLVPRIVGRMFREGFPRRRSLFAEDEAQSEGGLALLWIASRWTPGAATFETGLTVAVRRFVTNAGICSLRRHRPEDLPCDAVATSAADDASGCDAVDNSDEVSWAMGLLGDGKREVIRLRYGLGGDGSMTVDEIADRLGISWDNARGRLRRTHRELRAAIEGRGR